jgi:Domain of unknown function (DUF4382)
MSSVRSVALSGAIAAVIAIALILAVIYIPRVGLGVNSTPTSSSGTMEVLLTDPPTVPENVSAVYIQYSEVEAHVAVAGNSSGWYNLSGSGEVNLMSVVNVSQTIATSNLPAGKFNGLRFNVTGILVTYSPNPNIVKSQNYTGLMVNGHNTLYAWIPGGINVTAAKTSAALVDLAPTVVLAGNRSNPMFVFIPAATGYVIPSSAIPAESHAIGARINLASSSWWTGVERGTHFGITSVSLTPDSLSITVLNQGTSSVILRLAGVTTQTLVTEGMESPLRTSDIFVVESNGTLVNLNTTNMGSVDNQVASGGFILASGQSVTLTYKGPIEIGFQVSTILPKFVPPPIVPNQFYMVWVQGNGQIAQAGAHVS